MVTMRGRVGEAGAASTAAAGILHMLPILVASAWELTKETIYLPLGRLQGGLISSKI